ncbi:MAG: helix-turn-helix transcriptional regulator [Promethearchaeota archaeon]
MKINDLFFEFSNEGRFKVFQSLYKGSKKHSQLERELKIRGSEISRHIKRLVKKNLVVKTIDNNYTTTNIGNIFLDVLELFEVSLKFETFFNTHEISFIPIDFILRLGHLKSLKINSGTMQNIELWSELIKTTENYIFAISEQFQDSILPAVERKINNMDIEIRALVNENVLNSKGYERLQDRHAFYQKINIAQNIRLLKEVLFSLLVTDKGAILFLSKQGKVDYSECLFDNSNIFLKWSEDLFEWYWRKGIEIEHLI